MIDMVFKVWGAQHAMGGKSMPIVEPGKPLELLRQNSG